jgi:hypothetical protein
LAACRKRKETAHYRQPEQRSEPRPRTRHDPARNPARVSASSGGIGSRRHQCVRCVLYKDCWDRRRSLNILAFTESRV